MNAIEFEADVHNGIIKMPDKYKTLNKHFRFIAIEDEKKKDVEDNTDWLIEDKEFTAACYNAVIDDDPEEDAIWEKYL